MYPPQFFIISNSLRLYTNLNVYVYLCNFHQNLKGFSNHKKFTTDLNSSPWSDFNFRFLLILSTNFLLLFWYRLSYSLLKDSIRKLELHKRKEGPDLFKTAVKSWTWVGHSGTHLWSSHLGDKDRRIKGVRLAGVTQWDTPNPGSKRKKKKKKAEPEDT
jgi:hypothetical protein